MMSPVVADTMTAVIVLAAVAVSAVVPAAAAAVAVVPNGGGAAVPAGTDPTLAASSRRSSLSPPRKVLAWGQWGQERSQDDVLPRAAGAANPQDEGRAAGAASQKQVLDNSWTHAAFRAFHEMRAGRPLSEVDGSGGEEEPDAGRGVGAGPLAGVRRLTSSFQRPRGADRDAARATPVPAITSGGGGTAAGTTANSASAATAPPQLQEKDGEVGVTEGEKVRKHPSRVPPAACWHMQGRLTNAATGQTIALVEGVELARSLIFETAASRNAEAAGKRQKKLRDDEGGAREGVPGRAAALAATAAAVAEEPGDELEVDKELEPGTWTAFGALASSKFFMYKDPETGEAMEHFRNTPVEKRQAVRTYERFSQVVSHLLRPNGRVLVVSEWGGRFVKAETANNNGVEEVDGGGGGFFSGGSGGRKASAIRDRGSSASAPRRVFNLHFFVEARTPKEERDLKRWQDRPGARWIAFGSPPPKAHGCKEVYSYITGREGTGGSGGGEPDAGEGAEGRGKSRLPWLRKGERNDQDATETAGGGEAAASSSTSSSGKGSGGGGGGGLMSYTRYGECPTWYGTGRMCGLDVQAKRVDSFESLPSKLREQVLEVDPDFEAGPPGTMEEVRRAAREQRLEREEERRRKGRRSLRRPFGSWGSSSPPPPRPSPISSGGEL
ncbi:unnamed protein product [Scytosiphon promiscuus]